MTDAVHDSLKRWTDAEIADERARVEIRGKMLSEFESNPDFYGGHPWSVCYHAIGGTQIEEDWADYNTHRRHRRMLQMLQEE